MLHKKQIEQWVYRFGYDTDYSYGHPSILGNKGYGLAQMSSLGFPIPPGFTIITDGCSDYYAKGQTISQPIWDQVVAEIQLLEKETGKHFGGGPFPLLLALRSGAKISMPGMMDTLLNLGLNDETVELLGHATQDFRFAYDSYRRFIEMYGHIIMGMPYHLFTAVIDGIKQQDNPRHQEGLSLNALHTVIDSYKK